MSSKRVFTFVLYIFFVFSFFSVCYSKDVNKWFAKRLHKPCPKPQHFVLVHGYGGGAWSWFRVQSLAENSGYTVTAINLKGAGNDLTDPATVRTFDEYNKPLVDFFAGLREDEKVILVGYSEGGLSVTDISQKFSKKVKVAVYVAATMLKHGFLTKQDILDAAPAYTWEAKNDSTTPKNHVAVQEDEALNSILFRPVPKDVFLNAQFKGEAAENVPRVYIKTLFDVTLLPQQQDAMINRWPPAGVFAAASNHTVLSTDAFLLFGLMVKIAESADCN